MRATWDEIFKKQQSTLTFAPVEKSVLKHQEKLSVQRENYRKKMQVLDFVVIDTETTGLERPQPTQIAMVEFRKGEPVKTYNEYFLPDYETSAEAQEITGLSKGVLKKLKAKRWTKAQSLILNNWLKVTQDVPIVAHGVKFERDKVLVPALSLIHI